MRGLDHTVARLAMLWLAAHALEAQAIPAFARKYGTSCQTCHSIYPKLNPFGEAFRRRGYRFPGIDADAVAAPPIPLGQEAQTRAFPQVVWPGTLTPIPPLALGFEGQAALHPDPNSSGAVADNHAALTLHDLVGQVHLWAGGSLDASISFFAEVTFDTNRGVSVENARLHFLDLLGPPDLLNVSVGLGPSTLTSFADSSSYLADLALPSVAVDALYGATSKSFETGDDTAALELSGIVARRFDYSVGLSAGSNLTVQPTENVYAHLGAKLGGVAFDGSGSANASGPGGAQLENALTVDVFGYRASSTFSTPTVATLHDAAWVAGGAVRGQWGPVELDSGVSVEWHTRVQPETFAGSARARLVAQFDELSVLALPWLVPVVRFEFDRVDFHGVAPVWNARLTPGVVALVRPNLKVALVAQFESATGAPPAGWSAAHGEAAPASNKGVIGFENEAVYLRLSTAW